MRIISWNVNGIRAVEKKGELQNLIEQSHPDILFLQEIKAKPEQLSAYLLAPPGYTAHYNPAEKPGYAGTGVWIHDDVYNIANIRFMDSFPLDPNSYEGRVAHVEMTMKDSGKIIDIFGIYFPNGGKSEQAWQEKILFYKAFGDYTDSLVTLGHDVLWGGDLNCAHHPIDLARPKENDGKIGFHPVERAWLDDRVASDWYDIFRVKYPELRDIYSWWDVITRSREKNVGWRIDAWWGSLGILTSLKDIGYMPEQMGSDHCPIVVDI